ncbi:MAG: sigma-70 family RNA polymerase sigma factor [bacterium]|nr:sigma-70 family RNA polymerase sigma factor [bacterium]
MSGDSLDPLITRLEANDEGALDAIVARCLPRLHAYVRLHMTGSLRAHEASVDVVQSICREVLEARESFVYQGEGQMISWLLTTAMNKMRERARYLGRDKRAAARETPQDQVAPELYASLLTPSRVAVRHEEVEQLENAIGRLTPDHREVVILARIVGLPHKEIAKRMNRTEPSVRHLLGRAMRRLAALLGSAKE